MTLHNPGFEDGWTRKTHTGQEFGEIFVPEEWTAFWREGGFAPHDTQQQYPYGRPEMHVIQRGAPYDDPPRIEEGNQSAKLFTFYRIHDAGYYQRFYVGKGSIVTFGYAAHAWSSTDDNPHTSDIEGDAYQNFTFFAGIDATGEEFPFDESVVWGEGIHAYDTFQPIPSVTVKAQSDYVTVFIRSIVKYPFKHCDAYFDSCQVVVEEEPEPEPPINTIPPGGYEKVYWVVPADIPLKRRINIYTMAAKEQRGVGPSADDSRAWATELIDAGNKVKAVIFDRKEADKPEWINYYHTREPRIIVRFRGSVVSPPPSPPPNGNPPALIVHYSGNFVGLHSAEFKKGWDIYARDAKPTVMKTFTCGDALAAKAMQPEMLVVWRKHIGDDGSYLEGADLSASALEILDRYSAEMQTHHNDTGIPVSTIVDHIDVLESLNEIYPTFSLDHLFRAVDFDLYFSEHLHARYGDAVCSGGILTAAVGNPHESEFQHLLPLAQQADEYGDFLTYHGYWAADENCSYLVEHAPYHSMRWQEMDKEFNEYGFYPRYYLGECGICYTYPHTNGWTFVSTAGWKSCGSFQNYIDQLVDFNVLITAWNASNQGRCYGGTIFAYGGWGWDDFDFEPGDLAELGEVMKQYA